MQRCPECFDAVFDALFVPRAIRGRLSTYPRVWDTKVPWPIDGITAVMGPEESFKMMAWRSLAPHRFTHLNYAFLSLTSVFNIALDKDPEFSIGRLYATPLLIVTATGTELKGDFASGVVREILARALSGQGLWLHTEVAPAKLGEIYGYSVSDKLPKPVKL